MWLSTDRDRLPLRPHGVAQSNTGRCFGVEPRRAFERHRPAGEFVGGLDLALAEADLGQEVEIGLIQPLELQSKHAGEELLAERPFVEHEFDVESRGHGLLDRRDLLVREAARRQRLVIDAGGAGERAAAHGVVDDALDRVFRIAERAQASRHHAVDDLEIAAASELLELHQREIGLDAGRIAIHHQPDRAGRRNHRRLRVAEAVLPAELDRPLEGVGGVRDQPRVGAGGVIERHRRCRQALITAALAARGAGVVAYDAEHRLAVRRIAREGAELGSHLGTRLHR